MTGADYYVAPPGNSPEDLEDCLRLEVSGVDHDPKGPFHDVCRQSSTKPLRETAIYLQWPVSSASKPVS